MERTRHMPGIRACRNSCLKKNVFTCGYLDLDSTFDRRLNVNTMPGKCKFKDVWLESGAYKEWLLCDSKDEHKARCRFCAKTFDISSMGEAALRSHMKSKKHTETAAHMKTTAVNATTISTFFSKKGKGVVTEGSHLKVQVCSQSSKLLLVVV